MDPDEEELFEPEEDVSTERVDGVGGGMPAVPSGYRETGSRVLEVPEVEIVAGQRPGTEREIGTPTEYREVRPTALGSAQGTAQPRSMLAQLADLALDTGRVPRQWAGRDRPTVESVERGLESGSLDAAVPVAARPEGMSSSAPDHRDRAGMYGLGQGLTFGHLDELSGEGGVAQMAGRYGVGSALANALVDDAPRDTTQRDRARREIARASEQAPDEHSAGELAAALPQVLLPGGQGRMAQRVAVSAGQGLGMGALRGAGESEAEGADLARDAAVGGLTEGALAAGGHAFAEGAGPLMRRLARSAQGAVPRLERDAAQSGLEARGIWAQRAANMVADRPGGPQQLVRELDEIGAPLHPRETAEFVDRMLAEEGPRIGAVSREMDAAGQRVDLEPVIMRMDELARQQDAFPITGDAPAAALRGRARALTELPTDEFMGGGDVAPSMDFSQAHGQRMEIDRTLDWRNPDPAIASLEGQRMELRRSLSDSMQNSADAAGLGDEWSDANRRYALGMELQDLAGGAARQNVSGGPAGAISRAAGLSNFIHGPGVLRRLQGAVEMTAGPAAMQELRHAYPGVQYRALRALVPRLRTLGPGLERAAMRMESAARRGPGTLAAQHFVLMQSDPEYRRAYERANEQE